MRRRRNARPGSEPLASNAFRYQTRASDRRPARRSRSARTRRPGSHGPVGGREPPIPVPPNRHRGRRGNQAPALGWPAPPESRSAAVAGRRPRRSRSGRSAGLPEPVQAAGDAAAVPVVTVLFLQRHQHPGGVHPSDSPRIMQQHKGGQRMCVQFIRHQRTQLFCQPDSLVAQFVTNRRRSCRGPISFGEHRVDAAEHMRSPLGQQLGGRHPQRDIGTANLVLRTGDSLTDRRLGLQQRAGDLRDGQPLHQP